MISERRATRHQALAFRLDGHNLARRRPLNQLPDVAAACGVRNTPPGSAVVALGARVADLTTEAFERALDDRTLVEVLSVRISPLLVPARDAATFTLGALPDGEESVRAALGSLAPVLKKAGVSAVEALALTVDAATDELTAGSLTRGELSARITARLPDALVVDCRACASRHVSESLFRLAGVAGAFVIARAGKANRYVRVDQWLGAPIEADRAAARAELLRRYLGCFGPSTVEHFAAWAGIGLADARQSWDGLAEQLVAVEFDGRSTWLHADDVDRFAGRPTPTGVRLLPPYDAYLDQRDRATLVPDESLHRRVWKILGNPGVVLADGEVVALWRSKKSGRRLLVTVEPIAPLSKRTRADIDAEVALLAPLRGCTSVGVTYEA